MGFLARTTIKALNKVNPERKYQILEIAILLLFPTLAQIALVHFFY